jgi:AAA+ ATPase superfamily predicted ATPase
MTWRNQNDIFFVLGMKNAGKKKLANKCENDSGFPRYYQKQ